MTNEQIIEYLKNFKTITFTKNDTIESYVNKLSTLPAIGEIYKLNFFDFPSQATPARQICHAGRYLDRYFKMITLCDHLTITLDYKAVKENYNIDLLK